MKYLKNAYDYAKTKIKSIYRSLHTFWFFQEIYKKEDLHITKSYIDQQHAVSGVSPSNMRKLNTSTKVKVKTSNIKKPKTKQSRTKK